MLQWNILWPKKIGMDLLMVQLSYCCSQTCWATSNPKAKIGNIQLKWVRWILKEVAELPQLRDHTWHLCLWTLDFLNFTNTRPVHSDVHIQMMILMTFPKSLLWIFPYDLRNLKPRSRKRIVYYQTQTFYEVNSEWNFPIFRFGPLGIFTTLNNFDQNICASMPIFN